MSPFYAIDSTRVTLREYWWGSRSPMVLLGWILKGLRVRIPSSTDDPNVHEVRPFEVALLPPAILGRFEALDSELQRLDFVDPIYHWIPDSLTRTNIYWATYRHADGQHIARIHHRVWDQAHPADRGLFVQFLTAFTDGTFLVSSAGKPDMDAPASVRINRWIGAKPSHLWQSHLQRLSESGAQGIEPIPAVEELRGVVDRLHASLRDFHRNRGVFRLRTPAEEAQAAGVEAARKVAAEGGSPEAEVLAEMENLLHKKPGWKSALWILVLSALAFIAADRADGPGESAFGGWHSTVLLVLVLLFHEAGHWVAIKISGYKNLRMFFIPFFGAAVTGRHWNVEGWKKAIVSLAGPLPGILLGTFLAFLSLIFPNNTLHLAAILFIAVNGFNLLPFLPLDGGQYLDAILFSRNRWVSIAFKIAGIACLMAIAMAGSPMLGILAIVFGSSLPLQFRLARVKEGLKNQVPDAGATAGDHLPVPLAESIIGAVRKDLPPSASAKTIAEISLSLLESLCARPPGALLTLFFIGLHLGAIATGVIGLGVIGLSKSKVLGLGMNGAALRKHLYSCAEDPPQSRGQPVFSGEVLTLAAVFSNAATASNAFNGTLSQLPPQVYAARLGPFLLVEIPPDNHDLERTWGPKLEDMAERLHRIPANSSLNLEFSARASNPAAASNLTGIINRSVMPSAVFAPWEPNEGLPQALLELRAAWQGLDFLDSVGNTDEQVRALELQFTREVSKSKPSEARMARLSSAMEQRRLAARSEAARRHRESLTKPAEIELLDLRLELTQTNPTNQVARKRLLDQVASRLHPPEHAQRFPGGALLPDIAVVATSNETIQAPILWFSRPAVCIPRFLEWLCQQEVSAIELSLSEGGEGKGKPPQP